MALKDRRKRRKSNVLSFRQLGTVALGYKVFNCKKAGCGAKKIRVTGDSVACPKCGTVRRFTGDPKTDGSYPTEAGFFVLGNAPNLANAHGKEPTEIEVTFPFSTLEKNISGDYILWGAGSVLCKGDGEVVKEAWPFTTKKGQKGQLYVNSAPGQSLVRDGYAERAFDWGDQHFEAGDEVTCPGQDRDLYPHCANCKASVELRFSGTDQQGTYEYGYYKLTTTSAYNYDAMEEAIENGLRFFEKGFQFVPFKLRLVEKTRQYFDTRQNKRASSDHYYLELVPPPEITLLIRRMQAEEFMKTGRVLPAAQHIEQPALAGPVEELDPNDLPEPRYDDVEDAEFVEDAPQPVPEVEQQAIANIKAKEQTAAKADPVVNVSKVRDDYVDLWNQLNRAGIKTPLWSKVQNDPQKAVELVGVMRGGIEALDAGENMANVKESVLAAFEGVA